MAAVVYYCRPVKKIHKGFCLDTLEILMKYWMGGSYIVIKSTPGFLCGIKLLAVG